MPSNNLLIEIGTEELPPKSVKELMLSMESNLLDGLGSAGFSFTGSRHYATPRRLAVIIEDLSDKQKDREIEKRGPALKAAFDEDGVPTKALLGFARSCGVDDPTTLDTLKTDKGEWIVFRGVETGQQLSDEIEGILSAALNKLPIDRKMRWGSSRLEFVRPIHWLVLIYGRKVLPAIIMGKASGRISRGHRFMWEGNIEFSHADEYQEKLRSASVITSFEERQEIILQQLQREAKKLNGRLALDEQLLEEVTALVEWPCALAGSFDESFLEIPEEALISAMKEHQRYFHLTNDNNMLLPYFITVSNIESKDPAAVISGNERVIRPRLSDASFFYKKDAATTMEEKLQRLGKVVFQSELGTFLSKASRISTLAAYIATRVDADESACLRAGMLCKADLISDMVGEFPDLQGIMGSYYSQQDGDSQAISDAIRDHYLPTYSGGKLPSSIEGSCVALADKIDTLVGLFAIGQPPSGSRDPFALRRQTLGIIRICIENKLSFSLDDCLAKALDQYELPEPRDKVMPYILDRLATWYSEKDIQQDVVNAVRHSHLGISNLLEADHRIKSMQAFRHHEQAPRLAAANKRVTNILKKVGDLESSIPDAKIFKEQIEHELYQQMTEVKDKFASTILTYEDKLLRLAELQPFVDRYFDDVMVMSDDAALKNNRLALLSELKLIFLEVANFSLLDNAAG
ncbi:MAG: glycine--tRNA ligase subunit beta [Pseudomonadales bacterium]